MNKFFIGVVIGMFLGAASFHYGGKSVEEPVKMCNLIAKHNQAGTFEHEVKRTD